MSNGRPQTCGGKGYADVSGDAAVARAFLQDVLRTFRNFKALGDAAIAQVREDADLHKQIDPEANSIAIVVRHVAGNLQSRFTDFLTTDGEKPNRNRDGEFQMPGAAAGAQPPREEIMAWWNEGWATATAAIEALEPEDLNRTIYIRGEAYLVLEALNRSVTHTAYHVGQIVYVARHLVWPNWRSLSIPRGQSAQFAVGDVKTSGLVRGQR